jgi:hypothetical protein
MKSQNNGIHRNIVLNFLDQANALAPF